MTSIKKISPKEANDILAQELKKMDGIEAPEWSNFVKTGNHKQRPPENPDWWYVRAASILRNIYTHGPVGVSRMRMRYGGRKNRGRKPEKFVRASGNIIRKITQQLRNSDLIKLSNGDKKGNIITSKGQSILDKVGKKK
ncbi:MAG: 30S ribosomal protein S19e [Candidatus Woesearchaeota archaeon]|jgi:small subunit ribosomal protein S19e